MKTTKKLLTLVLAVLMCFITAVPALAVGSEGPDELCATAEIVSDENLTEEELEELLNTEGAVLDLEKLAGTATDDSEDAPVTANPRMRTAAAAPRAAGSTVNCALRF